MLSTISGTARRSRVGVSTAIASLILVGAAGSANAAIVQAVSGISSAGVPFEFEAHFTISGDTLTLTLFNNSSVHSQNPNDLLSSFYFDIVNGANTRPTMSYISATGDVWLTDRNNPDTLSEAGADIQALVAGDNSWQFKTFNAAQAPFNGFGVGTVGNSNLGGNGFNGNIVDGMDYSIYAGDVTTANLNNRLLVKGSATFVFAGLTGFTEADIRGTSVFGLGTAPDSLQYLPTPGATALLGMGGLVAVRRKRR